MTKDAYHSYLGLALLAQMGEPGLKPLDPVLCISQEARTNITTSVEHMSVELKPYWKNDGIYFIPENDEHYADVIAEDQGPPKSWMKIVAQYS